MNYILFDDENRDDLLPLTFTRPVSELRIGILTIREKWEKILDAACSHLTQSYLRKKYSLKTEKVNILINGSLLPDNEIVNKIAVLKEQEALVKENILVAACIRENEINNFTPDKFNSFKVHELQSDIVKIKYLWDLFRLNGQALQTDFEMLTRGRKSNKLSHTNISLDTQNIFVENDVHAEGVTLNAKTGPIYLGENSEIMEGSVIRGPFALCDHSTIKLSAKIYGPTTIGPHSKAGGEINNSVIIGYSNKAHDGFLGNSVIGEWCNIGADTNNSNLKNNYSEVKLWNYRKEELIKTGLQFCGLIMGDHSKTGINTMFNTGTVVGVNANIFGAGFPENFIPSFSWGGSQGFTTYRLEKAFEVAKQVMLRRNVDFDSTEQSILEEIFKRTEKYRN